MCSPRPIPGCAQGNSGTKMAIIVIYGLEGVSSGEMYVCSLTMRKAPPAPKGLLGFESSLQWWRTNEARVGFCGLGGRLGLASAAIHTLLCWAAFLSTPKRLHIGWQLNLLPSTLLGVFSALSSQDLTGAGLSTSSMFVLLAGKWLIWQYKHTARTGLFRIGPDMISVHLKHYSSVEEYDPNTDDPKICCPLILLPPQSTADVTSRMGHPCSQDSRESSACEFRLLQCRSQIPTLFQFRKVSRPYDCRKRQCG